MSVFGSKTAAEDSQMKKKKWKKKESRLDKIKISYKPLFSVIKFIKNCMTLKL